MEYHNPKIREGINVSKEHPLKELAWLGGGALLIILSVVTALGWLGSHAARYVDFENEMEFMADVEFPVVNPVSKYLQNLANELAKAQGIPASMPITVHYSDEETVNAFATLGGHIMMFSGLVKQLPNENALAMVLAHEIAHIHKRHPIAGLGRGLTVGIVLASLSGLSDSGVADVLPGSVDLLSGLHFSRAQEEEADTLALHAVASYYGHVQGAAELFEVFIKEREAQGAPGWQPQFLSTHPLSENRIATITAWAKNNRYPLQGELTPLPRVITEWKEEKKEVDGEQE